MNNEIIQKALNDKFGAAIIGFEEQYGMLTININAASVLEILNFLNKDATLAFCFLTDITAVHYPDKTNQELCVVYHLHNLVANKRIRLKAFIPIAQPQIPSVTPLYSSANWMERETYDFFGVQFLGHPNLVRILTVDEMNYFPLRKEYPMEDPTRIDKDDHMFGRV